MSYSIHTYFYNPVHYVIFIIILASIAIEKALKLFDDYTKNNKNVKITGKTIFLLSNLGSSSCTTQDALKLAKKLEQNEVELVVGYINIILYAL